MGKLTIDFDISDTLSLVKRLERSANRHIQYGWLTKSLHNIHGWEKKLPTAQIVFWNEFGTRNIPARPYLTITGIIAQVSAIPSIVKYFQENIYGSVFSSEILSELSNVIKEDFKATVGSGRPLSPATISKKSGDEHWVESGQLMDEFKVNIVNRKLV